MGLLNKILAPFKTPSIEDPDFGTLLYMDIPRNPSKSYWECEWLFPPTGTRISISLPGNREGPRAEARAFGVEDPAATPREWDISFETTGSKWLGITIPFVGDKPQDPVVDT